MATFSSCHAFRSFSKSIMRKSRYVFEPDVEEFLKTVLETGEKRKTTLPAGSHLYRAQLGFEWEPELIDPDEPRAGTYDVPGPLPRGRMKPLSDSAREGRVNPKGIPCLYLSDDKKTAMAEQRPWLDSYVSVGYFSIRKDLQMIDCSNPKLYSEHIFIDPPHFREPAPEEREEAVWGEIAHAFSEPVNPSDATAEYAPTQVLAEAFRKIGCDGIRYKSLLGKGHSFAVFDLDSADLISCVLYTTTKVWFEFEQGGNPYFVS
jgi:hypothetical protein